MAGSIPLRRIFLLRYVVAAVLLAGSAQAGDAMPQSLTGRPGDAARGRAIVISRQTGLCLLCHSGPFADVELQGNLAPNLTGIGSRLTAGQLRMRLVDPREVKADSLMPSYFRVDGRHDVAPAYDGKPILSAAEIEDVVAFLSGLRR